MLRVHQRTVQRWISSNQLKATKVKPKSWRVSKQDLHNFFINQDTEQEEAES